MAGSERGKFSTSGFHLTEPVSLLPIPPVRTLKIWTVYPFICFMTTKPIQYNTIHSDTQSQQLFQLTAQPLCVSTSKRKVSLNYWHSGNTFQCKTYDLTVHTLPQSKDQISLRTDDITHDIRTRICNIPPPSPFSLGKDKKSRVIHELKRVPHRWSDTD